MQMGDSELKVEKGKSIEDDDDVDVEGESDKSIKDDNVEGKSDEEDGDVDGGNDKSVVDDGEGKNNHDKGVYVGVADDDDTDMEENDPHSDFNFDGLADIWKEMTVGLESSKDIDPLSNEHASEEDEKECDHSFILKEDIGSVCRVCGII